MSEQLLTGTELEALQQADLTYPEVGGTRDTLPAGYHHVRRSEVLGSGRARFEDAAQLVLGWEMHRRAGLTVTASSESVVEGGVAVLRLGSRFLGVRAPVRVVYVVDEERRQGFAYGTLSGHPESGEEVFLVELHDDETVTLTISAFSRASTPLARAGGPVGRALQVRITSRYLAAV